MAGIIGNKGGRPRKPVAIHELDGTARKDRINDAEPKYAIVSQFEAPEWLDQIGKEHWLYHAPIFVKAGVLSEADFSLLNQASERWSTYRHAAADFRRQINQGLDFTKKAQLAHQAIQDYLALMREFGVGPASRTRVRVEKAIERDEFAELFDK